MLSANLSLDKLDIWVYGQDYHRVAMSAMLDASYLDVLQMVPPRKRDFALSIGRKKKLDSQKNGLLSFCEIAVRRALSVHAWGWKGAVGS